MKHSIAIFTLALLGASVQAAPVADCDFLTRGCVLQQEREADITTIVDGNDPVKIIRRLKGYLWND